MVEKRHARTRTGGSELNDSRQAIRIVQRGRVRRKQAQLSPVACEIHDERLKGARLSHIAVASETGPAPS
jgi:hypothetical protein